MRIFEVKDKTGRKIYLTKERWTHINIEHPEVSHYFFILEEVLTNPLRITDYEYDEKVKYYYRYLKNVKKYLLLIVKYLNGEGYIITSYIIGKIK